MGFKVTEKERERERMKERKQKHPTSALLHDLSVTVYSKGLTGKPSPLLLLPFLQTNHHGLCMIAMCPLKLPELGLKPLM